MKYFSEISWISVAVATIAGFVLGGLWFSPVMFAGRWMTALGKTKEQLGKPGPALALSFVVTLCTAIALAILIRIMPLTTNIGALRLGLTIGVVFYALATASDYAYTGWPRTIWWIQASYHVVMVGLMAWIVGVMRAY